MDRTGQLWTTLKKPESENVYVITDSRDVNNDEFEHDACVFTRGIMTKRNLVVLEGPRKWESYPTMVRIA